MSESSKRVLAATISGVVALAYIGVLLYISVPSVRLRLQRSREWATWYAWNARWQSLPAWMQEALMVRGKGPE